MQKSTAVLAGPMRTYLGVVAVVVVWTILSLVSAGSLFLLLNLPDVSFGEVWAVTAADAYTFAVLTVGVFYMVHRLSVAKLHGLLTVATYFVAAVVFVFVHLVVYLWLARTLDLAIMETPPTLWAHILEALPRRVYVNFTVFGGTAALCWVWLDAKRSRLQELRAAHLETELAQARLALLQRQMDSHFLFNTLHVISELIHTTPQTAEAMLMHLSRLLQVALRPERSQEVTVQEEMELLGHYLAIQNVRYGDRLTTQHTIAPEVEHALLPSLSLQTLVENAIQHGIAQTPGQGTVSIEAYCSCDGPEQRLHIHVRDNGKGVTKDSVAGIGLSNTHARLRHLYGEGYTLTVQPSADGGTEVHMVFPLRFRSPSATSLTKVMP